MKASWYSVESLKKEGTWKTSKGVMANGHQFKDTDYTCASNMHKLGTMLRVTNIKTGKSVNVKVTDRINVRFTYIRIDLSKQAFKEIADLDEGVIDVTMEVIDANK
jgi:rare lipoprotein A